MKNSKRFLMIFCAMTVLAATLFSLGISAVKAGEGTTIDEYTKQKVTKAYNFDDGVTLSVANSGTGSIVKVDNVHKPVKSVYGDDISLNYFIIDYYKNEAGDHHYIQPKLADETKVDQTPTNGFVAEFDLAFFSKTTTVMTEKLDEEGNIVYKQGVTDANGQPVPEMVAVQEPLLDDEGNQVLDKNGEPIMVDKVEKGSFDGLGGAGFAIDMLNTHTWKDGSINILSIKCDADAKTVTITVINTDASPNLAEGVPASYVFKADEWCHLTFQYDAKTMLTHIYAGTDESVYIDSNGVEQTGRVLLATKSTVTAIENKGGAMDLVYPKCFRIGASAKKGIMAIDNIIGYQGTTIHDPTYISSQSAYQKFTHISGVLNDETSSFINRYQAFDYLTNDSEMKLVAAGGYYGKDAMGNNIILTDTAERNALSNAITVYNEYYADFNDVVHDGKYDAIVASLKDENADNYDSYVNLALTTKRELANVAEREARVNVAEDYDTSLGNMINRSGDVYKLAKARLENLKAQIAGDDAAYNFCNTMNMFERSLAYGASISRLQAHYERAAALYPDISDYNDFDASSTSYNDLRNAVESFLSADGRINYESETLNSMRFINIISVMCDKSCGSWDKDGADVEALWYRALTILNEGNYAADTEGFADAKAVFDLAHNVFWNKRQAAHAADMNAKLDGYNRDGVSYIDRAGICTYVDRYLELNAADIDFTNAGIIAVVERNESYKAQLNTIVGDYKNLLVQNTTKFVNVMKRVAEYDTYASLKPLYDEATTYYYSMNVEGEDIDKYVAAYDELRTFMIKTEADSAMFIAIVNGTAADDQGVKYAKLSTITNNAELYASLTACYGCLDNLDLTYEGAAAAKAIYDAKYREYTNAANVANSQLDETTELVCSARGNWDFDGIVSFIKNLFDMIKE